MSPIQHTFLRGGALAAFATGLLAGTPLLIADDKANVLIIVADDLGYADLGCQGSKETRTPSIVALLPALESLDDEAPADDPASAERLAVVKKLTADAVASRHAVDYGIGLRGLESSNAVLTTTGAIFFEWLRGDARPHFKAVQKLVLE